MSQSYQEVSKEVIKEIKEEKLAKTSLQYQFYFYNLKQNQPARFERLMFDTNCQKPFSGDLEDILFDYLLAGTLTYVGLNDNRLYLKEVVLKS